MVSPGLRPLPAPQCGRAAPPAVPGGTSLRQGLPLLCGCRDVWGQEGRTQALPARQPPLSILAEAPWSDISGWRPGPTPLSRGDQSQACPRPL